MKRGIALIVVCTAVLILLGCTSTNEPTDTPNQPPPPSASSTTEAPTYVPTDVQVRREAAGFEPWTNAQYDTIQDLCQQLPINPDYQRLFRNSTPVEQAAVLIDMEFVCPAVTRGQIVLDQ